MKLKHRTGAYKEHIMDLEYSFDLDREDMLELLASWNGACPAGERIPLADDYQTHVAALQEYDLERKMARPLPAFLIPDVFRPTWTKKVPSKRGWYWVANDERVVFGITACDGAGRYGTQALVEGAPSTNAVWFYGRVTPPPFEEE